MSNQTLHRDYDEGMGSPKSQPTQEPQAGSDTPDSATPALASDPQPQENVQPHSDDDYVDHFTGEMKRVLKNARDNKGRSGWDDDRQCTGSYLALLLMQHLSKVNPDNYVDIANFCMMLHERGEKPYELAKVFGEHYQPIYRPAHFPTELYQIVGKEVKTWKFLTGFPSRDKELQDNYAFYLGYDKSTTIRVHKTSVGQYSTNWGEAIRLVTKAAEEDLAYWKRRGIDPDKDYTYI